MAESDHPINVQLKRDLEKARKAAESKRKEAEEAGVSFEPMSKYEQQTVLAEQYVAELQWRKSQEHANRKEKTMLAREIRDLKQKIKTARLKSRPFRARIKTLRPKWQKQWVRHYDEAREGGKSKSEAAALSWSKIKVHCEKLEGGTWNCPPWEAIYKPAPRDRKPTGTKTGVVYHKGQGKKKATKKKTSKRKVSKKKAKRKTSKKKAKS